MINNNEKINKACEYTFFHPIGNNNTYMAYAFDVFDSNSENITHILECIA